MSDRCELSDLPVDQCACRIHAPKPDPMDMRAFGIAARFPARFNSYCDECDAPMLAGDLIARTQDGDYICGECMS